MNQWLVQIVTAAAGTLGFALIFRIRSRNLIPAAFGGLCSWALFLLVFRYTDGLLVSNMAGAVFVSVWAGLMSRIMRSPVNIFMIPGIIPLLPGGALYYAMSAGLHRDSVVFADKGMETVCAAFGIALGILAVSAVYACFSGAAQRFRARSMNK